MAVNMNVWPKEKPSSPITGKGTPHNRHRFPSDASPKSQNLSLSSWVNLNTPPNPFSPPFPRVWVGAPPYLSYLQRTEPSRVLCTVCTLHPLSHPVPAYLPQQRVNVRVSVRAGGGEKPIQVPATERGITDVCTSVEV